MHLYHCHVGPLAEHIARGMYGAFIVDPKAGREDADELVMIQNGFNTNFDAEGNQVYAVNTVAFHYADEPVQVKRGELVRIYLGNMLEYDPINSFHVHGNFFDYYPTGTRLEPAEFTDTIAQVQGQRGILELRFPYPGKFMFHAHKTEFAELGWMGFFEVVGLSDRRPLKRVARVGAGARPAGADRRRAGRAARRSAGTRWATASGRRSRSWRSSGRSSSRARSS